MSHESDSTALPENAADVAGDEPGGPSPTAAEAPLVAIVGRPNVGKSTLFNRLVGARQAIVEDHPGVTRDRLYGVASHAGRQFLVVDTGGIDPSLDTGLPAHIQAQVDVALEEADLVLLVVDVLEGLTASATRSSDAWACPRWPTRCRPAPASPSSGAPTRASPRSSTRCSARPG
jgi:GTP-binding protein